MSVLRSTATDRILDAQEIAESISSTAARRSALRARLTRQLSISATSRARADRRASRVAVVATSDLWAWSIDIGDSGFLPVVSGDKTNCKSGANYCPPTVGGQALKSDRLDPTIRAARFPERLDKYRVPGKRSERRCYFVGPAVIQATHGQRPVFSLPKSEGIVDNVV